MTAEGRFLIRTWRDATKRRECNQPGVRHEPPGLVVPLAEFPPPIDERGEDDMKRTWKPGPGLLNYHGTETTYGKGCRCDKCREAAATARRERRRGWREQVAA